MDKNNSGAEEEIQSANQNNVQKQRGKKHWDEYMQSNTV